MLAFDFPELLEFGFSNPLNQCCKNCGSYESPIEGGLVSERAEWRIFEDQESDPSRCHVSQQEAAVEATSVDSPHEQRLRDAFQRIDDWGDQMSIPESIKQSAKEWYLRYERQKKAKSRMAGRYNRDAMIGAVLHIACKQNRNPRTFKEIAFVQGTVTETQIKRAYKTLQELLELQKDRSYAEIARIEPRDLVNRICYTLGIQSGHPVPAWAVTYAQQLADAARPYLQGKGPASIAAACTWHVLAFLGPKEKGWNAVGVAQAAGISPTTIYNTKDALVQFAGTLLPYEEIAARLQKENMNAHNSSSH